MSSRVRSMNGWQTSIKHASGHRTAMDYRFCANSTRLHWPLWPSFATWQVNGSVSSRSTSGAQFGEVPTSRFGSATVQRNLCARCTSKSRHFSQRHSAPISFNRGLRPTWFHTFPSPTHLQVEGCQSCMVIHAVVDVRLQHPEAYRVHTNTHRTKEILDARIFTSLEQSTMKHQATVNARKRKEG